MFINPQIKKLMKILKKNHQIFMVSTNLKVKIILENI